MHRVPFARAFEQRPYGATSALDHCSHPPGAWEGFIRDLRAATLTGTPLRPSNEREEEKGRGGILIQPLHFTKVFICQNTNNRKVET